MSDRGRQATVAVGHGQAGGERALAGGLWPAAVAGAGGRAAIDFPPCRARTPHTRRGKEGMDWVAGWRSRAMVNRRSNQCGGGGGACGWGIRTGLGNGKGAFNIRRDISRGGPRIKGSWANNVP